MPKHTHEVANSTFFYDMCKCGALKQLNTVHPMPWQKKKVSASWAQVFNFMPKGEVQ